MSGAHVQHAINAYQSARYEDAMSLFVALEPDTANMNPKGYCRYLIYRGLTHYHLGDHERALHYLRRGKEALARGDRMWIPEATMDEVNTALMLVGG